MPPADATADQLTEVARAALDELRYRLPPAEAAGDGRREAFDRLLAECRLPGGTADTGTAVTTG